MGTFEKLEIYQGFDNEKEFEDYLRQSQLIRDDQIQAVANKPSAVNKLTVLELTQNIARASIHKKDSEGSQSQDIGRLVAALTLENLIIERLSIIS